MIVWLAENLPPCPDGYTLDRINNNRGYEPGNLEWRPSCDQAANRRSSRPQLPDTLCFCGRDCFRDPEAAVFCDWPWEDAARGAVAYVEHLRRLRLEPLPRLVEHVHTGNYDDCFTCINQDPYVVNVTDESANWTTPQEWCRQAAGRAYGEPVSLPDWCR